MFKRTAAAVLFASLANAESASDKSWKNLRQTHRESLYTVALRDGRCLVGHIKSLDDSVTAESSTFGSLTFDRKDILRIGDGSSIADHDPIYSGRSSWSDLRLCKPNKYEHIVLELKKSARRKCSSFSATDDEAVCDGKRIGISEVARGYYVRLAPATDWEHYVTQESVPILAPRTWFDFVFYPRIEVLLYDESQPQDNEKVVCKARSSVP